MSCPCFPDSVLNLYILLNAWIFSTRNAHWTFSFLGFRSKNTRFESTVIFPGFGDLGYLSFFFSLCRINRKKKKSTHYPMLRENYHYRFGTFPPNFFCNASEILLPPAPLNSVYIFVLFHNLTISVYYFYNHNIWRQKIRKEALKVSLWYILQTFALGKLFLMSH